ncbi:hypothetical protein BZL35_00282 [Candidatus Pandoraea novymonadis]|uniref:Uncharacterized protein n=1 Tax=Candidatus Pandoraea novymonadis TaxID=1808959 RepID=A0ABX5FFE0_9BURK|nr:hypothetical protein BZL35_00282 [Candidatus Pandoraea novymonadis]
MVVLETAQPIKFSATLREALGHEPSFPIGFEEIETLPQRFHIVAAGVERVKTYIVNHTGL